MAHADQADDDGAEEAVEAFLTASRALVGVSARSLADADDVTLPQFRALVVLADGDGVTVSQLAERLDIHPSSATRLCDRLVRKELVRRALRDDDRREIEIALDAKGRRLVDQVMARRRRELAAIAGQMSAGDLRNAITGLTAFAAAAGETPEASRFGWPAPPAPNGTPGPRDSR